MSIGKNIEAWIKGTVTFEFLRQQRNSTWFLCSNRAGTYNMVSKTFQGKKINQFVSENFSTHFSQVFMILNVLRSRHILKRGDGQFHWAEPFKTYWLGFPSDTTGIFLPTWMSRSKWQVERDGTEGPIIYSKGHFSLVYFPWNTECHYFFRRDY